MQRKALEDIAERVSTQRRELERVTRELTTDIDLHTREYRARLIAGERSTHPILDLAFATQSGKCDAAFVTPLKCFQELVTDLHHGEPVVAFWRADVSRRDEDPQYFWHIFFGRRGSEYPVQYSLEYVTGLQAPNFVDSTERFALSLFPLHDTFYWDSFTGGNIVLQEKGKIGPLFISPGQHGKSCPLDYVIAALDPQNSRHRYVENGDVGILVGSDEVAAWLETLPPDCEPVRDAIRGPEVTPAPAESQQSAPQP